MIIALVVIGWVVCGVLAYGVESADWKWKAEHQWKNIKDTSRNNAGFMVFTAMLGPLGLFMSALATNFCQHGITWKSWGPK